MTDQSTFETRLADAFERYVAGAPVEVDSVTLAAAVASSVAGRPRLYVSPITRRRRLLLAIVVGLLVLALAAGSALWIGRREPQPPLFYKGVFVPFGKMTKPRAEPVLVTLTDGRVLIAASDDRRELAVGPEADVFDPATLRSVPVGGNTPSGRGSGIRLANGRVLTITYDSNTTSSYAYVFDPAASRFRSLPQSEFPSVPPFGVEPSMTLLDNGHVLVSGGQAQGTGVLTSAMLFDQETETFTPTGSMTEGRRLHSMTKLKDGRVLIVGGEGILTAATDATSNAGEPYRRTYLATTEIYDPRNGTFTRLVAKSNMPGASIGCLLPDGTVLLAPRGGLDDENYDLVIVTGSGFPARLARGQAPHLEVFDPASGSLSPGPELPGLVATETMLVDGRVLLTGERFGPSAGGADPTLASWAAIYEPASGRLFTRPGLGSRLTPALMLPDGRVIFAGGVSSSPRGNGDSLNVSPDILAFE